MIKHTHQTVHDLIQARWESLNPDGYALLRACRLADKDGRPILARDYKAG